MEGSGPCLVADHWSHLAVRFESCLAAGLEPSILVVGSEPRLVASSESCLATGSGLRFAVRSEPCLVAGSGLCLAAGFELGSEPRLVVGPESRIWWL